MIDRRRTLQLAAASALAPTFGGAARAQPIIYPDRAVRLVVPFAPLTRADLIARLLAARLADMWGEHVVVENHKGAGGNIAAAEVARAEPDGYTLLLASLDFAVNRFLYRSPGYDPNPDQHYGRHDAQYDFPDDGPGAEQNLHRNQSEVRRGRVFQS